MFLRPFFSTRLKLLRKSHFLTNKSLAFLLKLKNEASIRDYEAQRAVPSVDVLSDIANLFGVSIDWLAGRSSTPYNDEILLQNEPSMIDCAYPYFDYYKDVVKRCDFYPLPIRANIVFIVNVTLANSYKPTLSNILKTKSLKEVPPDIELHKYINTISKKISVELFEAIIEFLETKRTTPIFDISKPFE